MYSYDLSNEEILGLRTPGTWIADINYLFKSYLFMEENWEKLMSHYINLGLSRWFSGKESTSQYRSCRRYRFDPCAGKIPWRRKWQPTSIFLPGEFHGQRSLVGYSPWGHKDSDMPEWLNKNHNITCEFAWSFPNGKTYSPRVDLHVFVYVFSLAWIVGA